MEVESGRWLNCYNNTVKVHVEDNSKTYIALKRVCPWYIGKQPNSTYVCCDLNQIHTLELSTSQLVQQQLANCPSCYQNFMNVFCAITCDPSNSLFMDVQKLVDDNTTYPVIESADVYFTNYYADKFFNSCKNVQTWDGSCLKVVSVMCGSNNPCTGQKWLEFMGTPQPSSPASFTLNFTLTNESSGGDLPTNMSARNATLLKCSDPVNGVTCRCSDCPEACLSIPADPIGKGSVQISIVIFIGVISFVIYNIVFVIVVTVLLSFKPVGKYTKLSATKIPHRSFTSVSQKFQGLIIRLFSWWGNVSTDYWYLIIPAVLIMAFTCCAGLVFCEVTTDPIELWSVPNSLAQKEKEYFDQHFGYIYRASQIVIKAPNSPGFTFIDPVYALVQYNVSGMFQQDILNEVSILIILECIYMDRYSYVCCITDLAYAE